MLASSAPPPGWPPARRLRRTDAPLCAASATGAARLHAPPTGRALHAIAAETPSARRLCARWLPCMLPPPRRAPLHVASAPGSVLHCTTPGRLPYGTRPEEGCPAPPPQTESSSPAASSRPLLLGPPMIRGARPSADAASSSVAAPASHPFLDLLDAAFNAPSAAEVKAALKPHRALTENCSATYSGSGNPCLDFFFQVVPDTPPERVRELIRLAWAHDPLTALKLACNLRGVRGTGKYDKEGFYAAALWMHAEHPQDARLQRRRTREFGYLKGFPELVLHASSDRPAGVSRGQ